MVKTKMRFSLSLVLGSLALGQSLRSKYPVTVQSVFVPKNTTVLPRIHPRIYSSDIIMPWAASMLVYINRMEAWWCGEELESLRVSSCDEGASEKFFVPLYERSLSYSSKIG